MTGSRDGGPKCRYTLHSWADNIVVTMGGGIANEDNHDNDHEDLEITGVKLGKHITIL